MRSPGLRRAWRSRLNVQPPDQTQTARKVARSRLRCANSRAPVRSQNAHPETPLKASPTPERARPTGYLLRPLVVTSRFPCKLPLMITLTRTTRWRH